LIEKEMSDDSAKQAAKNVKAAGVKAAADKNTPASASTSTAVTASSKRKAPAAAAVETPTSTKSKRSK